MSHWPTRAHVMFLAAVLLIAFAASCTATEPKTFNTTILNKEVLQRLSPYLNSKRTEKDLILLHGTVQNIGVDKDFVVKLTDIVRNNGTIQKDAVMKVIEETKSSSYEGRSPVRDVEESPDHASSVVLAIDLLPLTRAVASIKETACKEQGYQFLDGLIMNKTWALKMFDASTKLPQGLLFGSSYHLGNFDECVEIQEPDPNGMPIEGQYCLATIKWKKRNETRTTRAGRGETLRWAVCVPSSCHASSVADFVTKVLVYTVSNMTEVEVTERDCYTRRPLSMSTLDVAYLSLILLFVTILIFSTLFEIYTFYKAYNEQMLVINLILSFSIIKNMKEITDTKEHNCLGLEFITGMKVLAMVFLIAGHACMFIASGPVMDADAWARLLRQPANAFMLNNTLLVDTFLMLSAFLFSRQLLNDLEKRQGNYNVIPYMLTRYIRATPAYLVVILFYMTWLPKIGEGPLWQDKLQLEQEHCMGSWWTNILYINNYVNTDKMCMFQSWYLSVEAQLFFTAPIFIYSLWRWRKFGEILLSAAIVISLVLLAVFTYKDSLDPTLLFYAKELKDIMSNRYFHEAYIKTHMRAIIYFMGVLTAYVLHRMQKTSYQFSFLMKTIAWITSVIIGMMTSFSMTIFYQDWYQYNVLGAVAFISLQKLAWGICNGWLIIACATGNGGILDKLLTWDFLAPFSRLTYCAYLVNGIVELYYVGELRHPLHTNFSTVMANAISHIVLTFFFALFLYLTFVAPLYSIEKILFKNSSHQQVLSDNTRKNKSVESSRNTNESIRFAS